MVPHRPPFYELIPAVLFGLPVALSLLMRVWIVASAIVNRSDEPKTDAQEAEIEEWWRANGL